MVEAAVIIVLLFIMLIPIIRTLNNKPDNSQGIYNASNAISNLTIEQSIANTIMGKALSGDNSIALPNRSASLQLLGFGQDGNFYTLDVNGQPASIYSPDSDHTAFEKGLPDTTFIDITNRYILFPKYKYPGFDIYYQWEVRDGNWEKAYDDATRTTYNYTTSLPASNNLLKVVLKIYTGKDAPNQDTAPSYTLATSMFDNQNVYNDAAFSDLFAFIFVNDVSGSMAWNDTDFDFVPIRALTYRPDVNDIFFGKKEDDPFTPYDERYTPCVSGDEDANINKIDIASGINYILENIDPAEAIDTRVDMTTLTTCKTNGINYSATNTKFYQIFSKNFSSNSKLYNLFTKLQDPSAIAEGFSRIEASRSSSLAFIETLESNQSLVKNFRLGFVAFSRNILDGTGGYPDEIVPLEEPIDGLFKKIKTTFFRFNRDCNYSGYTNPNISISCPDNKAPIVPMDATNISSGLIKAQSLFNSYEDTDPKNKLAKRVIILLSDGLPNMGITSNTGLKSLSTDLMNNTSATGEKRPIDIYSIGLLTGTDPTAQDRLQAIKEGNPQNSLTFVESTADLAEVYENIARQAEMVLLKSIQSRFSNVKTSKAF